MKNREKSTGTATRLALAAALAAATAIAGTVTAQDHADAISAEPLSQRHSLDGEVVRPE